MERTMEKITKVGVVGSGFIAKGFVIALHKHPDIEISKVLTRTEIARRIDFPMPSLLTNSVDELLENSDLILECSGDAVHATDVIDGAMAVPLPIVTMDSELQVTTGSYFAGKGFITEAEGDQPGCLAALRENALHMGFEPLVYGNIKGFLNRSPTKDDMRFWAKEQKISLEMVTSFTDGTKVQIEQALVANGLGAGIAAPGLLGICACDVRAGGQALAERATALGYPISDYILSPKSPSGVFVVAEHDELQRAYLKYYKLGEGPYYILMQNFHLCHLEIVKTIRRTVNGGPILLNNGNYPTISVAAIAKRPLEPGDTIRRGIGSFDVRGTAVRIAENRGHVPIGLLANALITRHIELGQQISFDDVELPDTLALHAWGHIMQQL